jgi:hypothetical protein
MPRKPRLIRCGARCRRNGGAPCRRWALDGALRCRQHGGATPRGERAGGAKNRKHGLYANTLTDEQKKQFEELFKAALDDPTVSMVADAVFLRLKAAAAAEKAALDPNGMVVVKQSATKQTTPLPDGTKRVTETAHIEKVDVTQPMSDLLVKAGRLAAEAAQLRRKAGIDGEVSSALTEEDAARILAEEFGQATATKRPEDADDGDRPDDGG